MKKTLFYILILGNLFSIYAQQVTYKTRTDDPYRTAKLIVNLELFQMDFGNPIDVMCFNIGAFGQYELNNKLAIDFAARKSWLAFNTLLETKGNGNVGNLDFELGGHLIFSEKEKTKDLMIILNQTSGYNTTTTTSLTLPGTKRITKEIRGGLITKRNSFPNDMATNEYELMFRQGVYGGISTTGYTNLNIDTDNYGTKGNSHANRVYLDVLFMPVNTSLESKTLKNNPLGFRFGYQLFEAFKKTDTGSFSGLCADFQVGSRPFTGFYMVGSIGLTIARK